MNEEQGRILNREERIVQVAVAEARLAPTWAEYLECLDVLLDFWTENW